jgi:hypothetical protein
MTPRGKTHEHEMLKIKEKTHILAWKEEGVSSGISKWLRRPPVKNFPKFVLCLPAKSALELLEKWTKP